MEKKESVLSRRISYGIYFLIVAVLVLYVGAFVGSLYFRKIRIFEEREQKMMSPDHVLEDLINGNKRFYSNMPLKRKSLVEKAQQASERGQFPKAVILACMDSRSIPEIIFDQTIADIFTLRVAGNVVNEDMLASLEFATKYSGSKVIVVMGHTQCGAIKAACAGNGSGNLEMLVRTIKPAVVMVQEQNGGKPLDCNDDAITKKVAMQNVHNMIMHVIEGSAVIRELLAQKSIKLVGALHDLETGVVTFEYI